MCISCTRYCGKYQRYTSEPGTVPSILPLSSLLQMMVREPSHPSRLTEPIFCGSTQNTDSQRVHLSLFYQVAQAQEPWSYRAASAFLSVGVLRAGHTVLQEPLSQSSQKVTWMHTRGCECLPYVKASFPHATTSYSSTQSPCRKYCLPGVLQFITKASCQSTAISTTSNTS